MSDKTHAERLAEIGPEELGRRMDAFMAKVVDDVDRVGWSATGVFPTEDHPGLPFLYTIGLTQSIGHPELIIVGMSATQAHAVIAGVIDRIKERGDLEDGCSYMDCIGSTEGGQLPIKVVSVDPEEAKMGTALAYYRLTGREEPFSALQVLWPDAQGRLPEEDGYDGETFPQPVRKGW